VERWERDPRTRRRASEEVGGGLEEEKGEYVRRWEDELEGVSESRMRVAHLWSFGGVIYHEWLHVAEEEGRRSKKLVEEKLGWWYELHISREECQRRTRNW
jgi:hypothetical protein